MAADSGAVSERQGKKQQRTGNADAARRRPPRKSFDPLTIGRDPGERTHAIETIAPALKVEGDAAAPAPHPLTAQRRAERRADTFRFRSPL
jgi:hypothetical protein